LAKQKGKAGVSEQGLTPPPTHRLSRRQLYRSKDPTSSIKVYWRKTKI